ncbi:uncharacterized protein LOC131851135 isoform X2 [Achroia grisella]|uniref:uncharacterized protein LOC131851135 isoform X2 n=1 Tax=Achroia grisella TaxID=688607 RepID=UPI0027D29B6B|nr:uncharacterized protein LOC131851135 isoform X2 [Achroia grisella]
MDNTSIYEQDNVSISTSSSTYIETNSPERAQASFNKELRNFLSRHQIVECDSKKLTDISEARTRTLSSKSPKRATESSSFAKTCNNNKQTNWFQSIDTPDPCWHLTSLPSAINNIGTGELVALEKQTKALDAIYIQDQDDDCSIYKRLTRKCHCLNRYEYNDFIIHFNENTKYFTSNIGEIIKNMRILKKFLYMNGGYTNKALMFLNEGLRETIHSEKVEITQGCAYTDMCNVFDNHSIVTICVSWPCKYQNYGDTMTQALAAKLLYKLAQLEEGRRYLNFSSKITNDIKKLLRKKASKLDFDTTETLNATLNVLHPPLDQHVNITYYCKPVDQALTNKIVNALVEYREYMTLDEVFTHLDLLKKLSQKDSDEELTQLIPAILNLFKNMLIEYDNSGMNIIVTNILNNIVSNNLTKETRSESPATMIIADTATEPIKMKNVFNQIPLKKYIRKNNKSKLGLSPNKHRQPSKRKVTN